jgi:hypothetical protein
MKLGTLASLALSTVPLTPAAVLLAQGSAIPEWQQVRNVPHGVVQRLEYQSESIARARERPSFIFRLATTAALIAIRSFTFYMARAATSPSGPSACKRT